MLGVAEALDNPEADRGQGYEAHRDKRAPVWKTKELIIKSAHKAGFGMVKGVVIWPHAFSRFLLNRC
jgi:hypothetical protein